MDQDETTTPATAEEAAEDKPGKVLQTFLVRLTIRANANGSEGTVPTNEALADQVESAVYGLIDDVDRESIRASAEKV